MIPWLIAMLWFQYNLDVFLQEPKQKNKEFRGSAKRKGFESDEDSPPRKTTTHRRMAVVYDSDEE